MALSVADRTRHYADRLKGRGSVSMSLWIDKDLKAAMERCRGEVPRATFVRHVLAQYLAWHEHYDSQVDLMDFLANNLPDQPNQNEETDDDIAPSP